MFEGRDRLLHSEPYIVLDLHQCGLARPFSLLSLVCSNMYLAKITEASLAEHAEFWMTSIFMQQLTLVWLVPDVWLVANVPGRMSQSLSISMQVGQAPTSPHQDKVLAVGLWVRGETKRGNNM